MSSILNAVYNNYLTAYAPKSLTQYDTHKKSELRSVYNSIVKINRDAPWYLPTSREAQSYAVSIKESARELRNVIGELGGMDEAGMINKKTAYSSDESKATAVYIGSGMPNEEIPELELEIHSLATPQENLGLFLPAGKVTLPEATYSFDIGINDINYEFQFAISENETNRDVQERLQRLINNADISLQADIVESDGRTALRLTSVATGLAPEKDLIFSVTDDKTSKRAGAVQYFGLDYISSPSKNATFSINGEEHAALSNHFTVAKMYELQLHNITDENSTVHIGIKADVESLTDNIIKLANGYNDFVKAASAYTESQSKGKQLLHELSGLSSVYRSSLESAGISFDEEGNMKVDRELIKQTANASDDLSESFGSLKNLSDALLRKSHQISLNPMNYVQKTVVAYKNPGHNFTAPYTTSSYSGMMFNSYC